MSDFDKIEFQINPEWEDFGKLSTSTTIEFQINPEWEDFGKLSTSTNTIEDEYCKPILVKRDASTNTIEDEYGKPILVKRDGEFYLIKGTNVIYNINLQCIIGYKRNNNFIFEENEETIEMCEIYNLLFEYPTMEELFGDD